MRVIIDASSVCWPHRSGIARYTIGLCDALRSQGEEILLAYRLSRWGRRKLRHRPPGVETLWVQEPLWPLSRDCDLFHGPDARVPRWRQKVRVATLHDVYSLLFEDGASAPFIERKRQGYRRLADSCDRIIAVSNSTRRDFLAHIDYPEDRIDVVYHGVDQRFSPGARNDVEINLGEIDLPENYLLYVGELSTRKNVARIVRGFARSSLAGDYHLLLAGRPSHGADEVRRAIEEEGGNRVIELGYVADEALPGLYARSSMLVQPTMLEGFGLPLLEGMASGVPVVASATGAAPEIAGGHGVLVDPVEIAAITEGIEGAIHHSPEALEAARIHAEGFTWEQCARETMECYRSAVSGSPVASGFHQ